MKKCILGIMFCLPLFLAGCDSKKQSNDTPQEVKTSDFERISVVINGHEYEFDVASGPTKEKKSKDANQMEYTEKLKQMFWSPKPALGYVEGDYYHGEKVFSEGYIALIDLAVNNGKIVHIELDEVAPKDYYAPEWADIAKRYSGYTFFQAKSQRTDSTMVTLVNGFIYFENQVLKENRLTGSFKTVRGASNSINRGFIPLAAELAEQIKTPSGKYYYSLVKELGGGITGRLEVIAEGDKIIQAKYDEMFDDMEEGISNPDLKQFYRQSKYYSISYPTVTGANFKVFADEINQAVQSSQGLLKLSKAIESNQQFKNELVNYKVFATELESKIKAK